jgi:23S rRNA (cytosine1962-C5)-methyltransferase
MPALIIKPGREKSLMRRHPWIFSGAIAHEEDASIPGQTVEIISSKRDFLAQAAYSPHSQIRARIWTYDPNEKVDEEFFRKRISTAMSMRQKLGLFKTDTISDSLAGYRLIHSESDSLPGLIVDRYANCLVAQFLSAGAEYWKETLADLLVELTGIGNIYERSDADVRQLEGLSSQTGTLRGDPSEQVLIIENGLKFDISVSQGHKTGFYLDQRLNRLRVRNFAHGCDVLDCFCYTGGFSINALSGGANTVLALDSSEEALNLMKENITLNDLPMEKMEFMEGDVFHSLRKFRDARRTFDMIILDPPKFAQTSAQAERAARGYKDINLLAFKLLRPGGLLFTFSCSGGIGPELFQKIVAGAALDAGVDAQIIEVLSQSGDHPVGLNFPEGAYLKGLVCIRD